MCHNVHMVRINIRELHMDTGRWVKRAADRETVVITSRGTPVAVLASVDVLAPGKSLPNRWKQIKKMRRIPVDSGVYVSEMRGKS